MAPQDIQTPASPLGSFPELAAMYRSSFQLPLSNANVSAQSSQDQTTIANQKAAEAAAEAAKYQQVQRADGGYGFYDPNGNEISAAQYAGATGKSITDVLKNSANPIDTGFLKDFKDFQDYTNLRLQSKTDSAAKQKQQAIEAAVKETTGVDLSKLEFGHIYDKFQQAYPTIFGNGGFQGAGTAGIKAGTTFIPQATDSFVQNYQFGGGGQGVK